MPSFLNSVSPPSSTCGRGRSKTRVGWRRPASRRCAPCEHLLTHLPTYLPTYFLALAYLGEVHEEGVVTTFLLLTYLLTSERYTKSATYLPTYYLLALTYLGEVHEEGVVTTFLLTYLLTSERYMKSATYLPTYYLLILAHLGEVHEEGVDARAARQPRVRGDEVVVAAVVLAHLVLQHLQ